MDDVQEINALGTKAFTPLQAEREQEWLHDAFVPPPRFAEMADELSIVVFGESGSGKTALRLAIQRAFTPPEKPDGHLLINWSPPPPGSDAVSSEQAEVYMGHLFDACAQALLLYIGQNPQRYREVKPWAQESMRDFVHHFLKIDLEYAIRRIEEDCIPEGFDLLWQQMPCSSEYRVFTSEMPLPNIINEFSLMLTKLWLKGAWILVDQVESYLDVHQQKVEASLLSILSSLALFEERGFVLKLMLPLELRTIVNQSTVITRRRVETFNLDWRTKDNEKNLVELVKKRLALAAGKSTFDLNDLTKNPSRLLDWLKRFGCSPRGWLALTRPVYVAWAQKRQPLSDKALVEVLRNNPPRLKLDIEQSRVYLGEGEVKGLEPGAYRVLEYLYKNRGRVCTRDEIYYYAMEEQDHAPIKGQLGYKHPVVWQGALNTILWRLRNKLRGEHEENKDGEENSDAALPEYIITLRKRGIQLDNTD
jgi:hypothetical protein